MDVNDLQTKLAEAEDKFSIFENEEIMSKYSLKFIDIIALINEFLTDEEKVALLQLPHFKVQNSFFKSYIISTIKRDRIKLNFLLDDAFLCELNDMEIEGIVKTLDTFGSMKLLHKPDFFKKHNLGECKIDLMKSLPDEYKEKILENENLVKELEFSDEQMADFIKSMRNENVRNTLSIKYNINGYAKENKLNISSEEELIDSIENTDVNNLPVPISSHKQHFNRLLALLEEKIAILKNMWERIKKIFSRSSKSKWSEEERE